MRTKLKSLSIASFGPFRNYLVEFPTDESSCVLLTGKNNQGKSSIINALRLISAATRVIRKNRQRVVIDHDEYFKLLQQDTENLQIERLIYDYGNETAKITANFSGEFQIRVYLDPSEKLIYADYKGQIPTNIENLFGFLPTLGPLSEIEEVLVRESYIRENLNTSLAPRHFRNQLLRLLSREEFRLVKEIIKNSWEEIELLDYEISHEDDQINCFYREGRTDREICWAGQGLQVWFQIIANLVRLRNVETLIFDEPEINLHPEKQNELIRIIKDNFSGTAIIATHSVELMNNVSVSHILNIQKKNIGTKSRTTSDRGYLELVRSQIGSSFNLVASQFEACDLLLFTEDVSDFSTIRSLSKYFEYNYRAFNVPLHGFSEHPKAIYYKDAYKALIGRDTKCSMVLDRDYYPPEYLKLIKEKMATLGIQVSFTLGKEIENLFINPEFLKFIFPTSKHKKLDSFLNELFDKERVESWGSFVTLHANFLPNKKLDHKTIVSTYMPSFEMNWNDPNNRWQYISGKKALGQLRDFARSECSLELSTSFLIKNLAALAQPNIRNWIKSIYLI